MSTESLLWALAFFAYVTAGFLALFVGQEIGRKMSEKERGADNEKNAAAEYKEIHELYKFCVKKGINADFGEFMGGFIIVFPDGGDFVQHKYSHGSEQGYIEPAIGSEWDYTAVSLAEAKCLVRKYRKKLSGENGE